MNISKILLPTITKTQAVKAQPRFNPYMTQGIQRDTFERSNVSFEGKNNATLDINQISIELGKIKGDNKKPKFNPKATNSIINTIKQGPEKWEAVKSLANNPSINGKQVAKLAKQPLDKLNEIKTISEIKTIKNESRFTGEDLLNIVELPIKDMAKVKPLAETKMYSEAIVSAIYDPSMDITKLAGKAKQLEKAVGNKLQGGISIKPDIYDNKDAYVMTADLVDYGSRNVLLDKKFNTLAAEEVSLTFSDTKNYQIIKTNDYRNHTTSKVRMEVDGQGVPTTTHEVRIIRGEDGKVKRKEYMSPSEIKGVFNVKHEYPDGKVVKIAEGFIDEIDGITTIRKDMTSLNGTRTKFLYQDDKEGNRITEYKITDKTGKILYEENRVFEVLANNKFKSTTMNTAHEITLNSDNMKVKNLETEQEFTIPFKNFVKGNKGVITKLLKKVPGEELIKMQENVKTVKGANSLEDCYLAPGEKEISTVDDLYAFLHELGHSKDFKNLKPTDEEENGIYSNDKNIQKIYMKEKGAFTEAFPNAQREHINYFIDQTEHYAGEWGGLGEVVAEANALVQTYNDETDIAPRVQYLQQYFPETIAYLGNKFKENVEETKRRVMNKPSKTIDMNAFAELRKQKTA